MYIIRLKRGKAYAYYTWATHSVIPRLRFVILRLSIRHCPA
jgi:hypothetical protein